MVTDDLKSIREKIEFILKTYPKTRDSDKLLWLKFMHIYRSIFVDVELGDYGMFQKTIMHKDTPTFETVSRARRKIQEMNEDLRGELYHHRQYKQEDVKKCLKEF